MSYIHKHIVVNHLITDRHLKNNNRENIRIEVKKELFLLLTSNYSKKGNLMKLQ